MALQVDTIDCKVLKNAKRHRTDRFEIVHEMDTPVIRRGAPFEIDIKFKNRSFQLGNDRIRIGFNYGPQPKAIDGTRGAILLSDNVAAAAATAAAELDITKWGGKIKANVNNTLTLSLMTPCDIAFGPWELYVDVAGSKTFVHPKDVWILFNPWMKDDYTFMAESELLDEYILADVGKIWVGAYGTARGREWVFGQFDSCVLPAAILMLDRAGVPHSNRGNPVVLSRALSRITNSNDDHGVLTGRWDGNYKDGTSPSAWTGSVEILDAFVTTEESVQYGQCWVFAGVITTVCRALGIPSRVVSNLVSAHDANGTLTIDHYLDENNEVLEYDPHNRNGNDSVWNYHVWNDVYMSRPDLPIGYGGWQAIDATPQEQSNGLFQCGPASLEAIRQGAVGLNYDVPFLTSSVNADIVKWKIDPSTAFGYQAFETNRNSIGKMVLTKRPGIFDPNGETDREDIVSQYKATEGSKAERLVLYKAVQSTTRAKRFYSVPEETRNDVSFTLVDLDRIDIGQPFKLIVKMENTSNEVRTIEAVLSAHSTFYTGVKANEVRKTAGEVVLQPNKKQEITMNVTAEDYINALVEYNIMKLYAICNVKETKQVWWSEDDFQVIKPNVTIKLQTEATLHTIIPASLTLVNPLNKMLTNCAFKLTSPGLFKGTVYIPFRNIKPNEEIQHTVALRAEMAGEFKIVTLFSSKELNDVSGSAKIYID